MESWSDVPPVRVGVAGVGSLGFHHARILGEHPGAHLVGIHDADAARAAEVEIALGTRAYPSLEDLLEGIDALVVAVPTTTHEEVACAALSRGVHVLVEKPIAPTLAAADRILAAAATSGALVQIGHIERFNGVMRACVEHLDDPLFVESHRLAPFGPRGTDVAVVLDLMIHDLDLLIAIMQRPVLSVAAMGVPVLTTSPDIANARLEFEGGAVANLTASRVSLERLRKIRFFQPTGYISLDLAAGTGEYLRLRSELRLEPGVPLAAERLEDVIERVPLRGDGVEPLRAELDSFLLAAAGHAPVVVTGEQGRRALAVALDIVSRIEQRVALATPA